MFLTLVPFIDKFKTHTSRGERTTFLKYPQFFSFIKNVNFLIFIDVKSLLKISIGFIIKLAGDSQEYMQIIFNDKLFTTIPPNKQTTSILSSKKNSITCTKI